MLVYTSVLPSFASVIVPGVPYSVAESPTCQLALWNNYIRAQNLGHPGGPYAHPCVLLVPSSLPSSPVLPLPRRVLPPHTLTFSLCHHVLTPFALTLPLLLLQL